MIRADLSEARRLLGMGLKLVELQHESKQPVGMDWNKNPITEINPEATGYGLILAQNKLCSVDPDNWPLARRGMAALGFDLEDLMSSGVRTTSTRPGSGGRSTFAAEGSLEWIKFRSKSTGTVIEFRAASANLQDCIPGLVYRDKAGRLCQQQYGNCRRLDEAPPLPDRFLAWWERCSMEIEFLHEQERLFFATLETAPQHSLSTGKGTALAFPAPYHRSAYNDAHTAEEVLQRHGYTYDRRLERWAPPTATGEPGVRPIPGKDGLWRSDHASDPLSGTFDAWIAFVVLDHDGNLEAAKRAVEAEGLVMDFRDAEPEEPEAPQPIPPFDLWGKAPPVGSLPRGLLPQSIETLAFSKPETFPPASLAMAALATCSMAASDLLKVEINANWRERFTIWVALVGSSACGKSPTINLALRPLTGLQTEAFERHEIAVEDWRARKKAAKGKDEFDEPEPVCERFLTHNATIEALTEIERTTAHGLGLIHDELSALIAAMDGAYKDRGMSERGHWLALYDGGPHTTDRIQRGSVFVRNHSAAILGGITTDKLRGLVSRMAADGLMSRMSLVTMPVSEPSDDLDPLPFEAWRDYEGVVQRIARNRPRKEKTVPLDDAARSLLGTAKKRWQSEALRQADNFPRYSERLGKFPGLAARLALGLAVIESAEVPGNGPGEIDLPRRVRAEHMERAIRLVDYLSGHDLAFYAGNSDDEGMPGMVNARRVAGWILRHGKREFKLGEVTRGIREWRALKAIEQAGVLELLEQLGWVVAKTADNGPAFRGVSFMRGTRWLVADHVHQTFANRAEHERQAAAEARERLQENISETQTS